MQTEPIRSGTSAFRRTNLAMFSAGFSTFSLVYCVQPLMPVFSREFHVSPAASSLSVSLTTGLLAVAILAAGSLSEAWGRKLVMVVSLLASAILSVLSAFMPGWRSFLLMRALEGIAFSGLPAVAMAYLSEEMHPASVGLAMGIYIGGGALGGMAGRFSAGLLTDLVSWRFALGVIGGFGILTTLVFWRALPPSVHFHPRPLALKVVLASFLDHFRDAGLLWLFAEGFLLLGCFTTVYNYIGYRLVAPPYGLSQTSVGTIFAVYIVGIGSSAWVGDLAGRRGRRKVLWSTFLILPGWRSRCFARLRRSSSDWWCTRSGSSERTPSRAVGSVSGRARRKRRHPRCICSSTTWGRACSERMEASSGAPRAGVALPVLWEGFWWRRC